MAEETNSQNYNIDPNSIPPSPITTPVPEVSQI